MGLGRLELPTSRLSGVRMGLGRLELPTSRLSGVRSNHLSYRPYNQTKQLMPACCKDYTVTPLPST